MGRGDAAMGQARKFAYDTLNDKYEALIRNKSKKIVMKCYRSIAAIPVKHYIHLVIPSETERENTYDVIFEFTTNDKKLKDAASMVGYDVKVFSNSPSFAYTFAYVYLKNDLMIKSLSKKLGKEFVKISPDVRNRYQVVNYEKYIFFGAKYIMDSNILNKENFSKAARDVATGIYPGHCRTLQEVMKEYDSAKGKLDRKNRQNAKTTRKEHSGTTALGKPSGIRTIKSSVNHPNHVNKISKGVNKVGNK